MTTVQIRAALFLIHIKHRGDFIVLCRLGQSEREQDARFLRNQAVAGNGVRGKIDIGVFQGDAAGNS
ncbi:hypothetical protein D3C80_1908350 [compost metagenome]